MDCCENIFDAPLTYEEGWGKKLTYLIAFSNNNVVDVSKRYVIDPEQNLKRRTLVSEEWLKNILDEKRKVLMSKLDPQ